MNNKPSKVLKRRNRKLAGVCGGISAYTGIPVGVIRAITATLFLFSPISIACYVITASMLEKGEDYEPTTAWDYSAG